MPVSSTHGLKSIAIMYHDVVDLDSDPASGFPGFAADRYKLGREEFRRHMAAIHSSIGGCSVILTFDDGGSSAHDPVAGVLEHFGWRGYFFISTDWIDRPGFLTEAQICELDRRGHIIGSHSCSHPTIMSRVPLPEMSREWKASTDRLAEIVGHPVRVASVPGGYSSRAVVQTAADAGIETIFTSEPTTVVRMVGACRVHGRFVVRRGMGSEWSAGFAVGKFIPRFRQALAWRAKGLAKAVGGGSLYVRAQEAIFNRLGSR